MTFLRLVILSTSIALTGCVVSSTHHVSTIRVAAASDLQNVLPELVTLYRNLSDTEVILTFGASGQLAEQIKAGAPFDVFLSANQKYVDDLETLGYIRQESIASYAIGSLVLAVHEDAPALSGIGDLTRPDVKKVTIANPDFAPYGAAARQALKAAGLWDSLQPKIVLAESVRQALQYVQTGNAEAGLVSKATASGTRLRVIEIDPKLYDPIVQDLAIVTGSTNLKAAEGFRTFMLGETARNVLASHGFRLPGAP